MQPYSIYKITPLSEIKTKDWKYLEHAIVAAEKSRFTSSKRLGACIEAKKSGEFYCGENQHREKTGKLYNISLHAEMNALYQTIKFVDKRNRFLIKRNYHRPAMTIYIVRLMKSGKEFGCCKPCHNCQKYLALYNITRIKYTDVIDGITVLCELRINLKNINIANK